MRALQAIEHDQHRVRDGVRWGPRTLDRDVLLYGQQTISTPDLTVPHPEMCNRAFVMEPLFDVAPDLCVPGRGALAELRLRVDRSGVDRLEAA